MTEDYDGFQLLAKRKDLQCHWKPKRTRPAKTERPETVKQDLVLERLGTYREVKWAHADDTNVFEVIGRKQDIAGSTKTMKLPPLSARTDGKHPDNSHATSPNLSPNR